MYIKEVFLHFTFTLIENFLKIISLILCVLIELHGACFNKSDFSSVTIYHLIAHHLIMKHLMTLLICEVFPLKIV